MTIYSTGCLNEGSTISKLQCLYEKARYFDMSRSCISCMSLSGFDYGTLIKNCFIKQTRSNLPGLLVLSKRRLIGPSLTYFDPEKTILNRAYISFEVHIFRLSVQLILHYLSMTLSKYIHSLYAFYCMICKRKINFYNVVLSR